MNLTEWSGPPGSAAWWSFWSGVLAAVFALVTAVAGGAAFFTRQAAARESAARTKQLELRVAEQQERAASAERDLLELKERQNDRQLTDAQYLALVNELAKAKHKPHVQIMYLNENEPKRFSELLGEIFERAGGWTVEVVKWNRAGMLTPGIFVESPHGEKATNDTAQFIATELVKVGTPAMMG